MALPIWKFLGAGLAGSVAVAAVVIAVDPDLLARLRGGPEAVTVPSVDDAARAEEVAGAAANDPGEPAGSAEAQTDAEGATTSSGEGDDAPPPVAVALPSFDVVRVEPDGSGLVAGQAEPGEAVALVLDGTETLRVESDAQGRFVAFLDLDPSDVPRTLALLADPEGAARRSDETVIVSPFRPLDLAPPDAGGEAVASVASESAGPGADEEVVASVAPEDAQPSAGTSDGSQVVAQAAPAAAGEVSSAPEVPAGGGEDGAFAAPEAGMASAPDAMVVDPVRSDAPDGPTRLALADAGSGTDAAEDAAEDLPSAPEALAEAPEEPEVAPTRGDRPEIPDLAHADEALPEDADRLARPGASGEAFEAPGLPEEPEQVATAVPEGSAIPGGGDGPAADEPDDATRAAEAGSASEVDIAEAGGSAGVREAAGEAAAPAVELLAEAPALTAPEDAAASIAGPAALEEAGGPGRLAAADLPEVPPPGPGPEPERVTAPAPDGSETVPPDEGPVPEEATAPEPPAEAPSVIVADSSGVRVLQPATGGERAPEVMSNVALDTITYDPEGEVLLGGRAGSGGFVQVYIDNDPVTTSRIAEDGQWRLELPDIKTGVYTLRVDEVDAGGEVLSRIETPFRREAPETIARVMAEETSRAGFSVAVRTVQPGNTLWAIAEERYGEGVLYVRVFEANRDLIRDPDLIYPGQVFRLPEGEDG